MKKKGYWVFLGIMVLVGALLISNYYFQRVPVIPDVNAQMSQFDNMGSYVSTGSYFAGSIPSENWTNSTCGSTCAVVSCRETYLICDVNMTILTCSKSNCRSTIPTETSVICETSYTCGYCRFGNSNTMLFCPTSTTCDYKCLNIGSQNPIVFPVDVGPSWQPGGGPRIPGSIVNFPVWSISPIGHYFSDYGYFSSDYVSGYSQYQNSNVGQSPTW